jgi:hypothetical protein
VTTAATTKLTKKKPSANTKSSSLISRNYTKLESSNQLLEPTWQRTDLDSRSLMTSQNSSKTLNNTMSFGLSHPTNSTTMMTINNTWELPTNSSLLRRISSSGLIIHHTRFTLTFSWKDTSTAWESVETSEVWNSFRALRDN